MVACKNCSTPNSLDSSYCKRCGAEIPSDELALAKEKLEALVAEGVTALNEGKIEEATAIGESAITTYPSSINALSLMTSCHERKGEISEALECAERIVELNPDSELDRIKRNQLRSALFAQSRQHVEPDRKGAMIAAGAAGVLVLCLGMIVLVQSRRGQEQKLSNGPVAQVASANPTSNLVPNIANQPTTDSGQSSNSTPKSTQTAPAQTETNDVQAPESHVYRRQNGPDANGEDNGTTLPHAGGFGNTTIEPMNPFTNGATPPSTGGTSKPVTRKDPDPAPDTNTGTNNSSAEAPPKKPTETIEISVHHTGPRSLTGGSEDVSGSGLQALVRTGRERFMVGNFPGAADCFERALRLGGDQISLNQRLGQSYQRIGRSSEAASAYNRSIVAAESAIAAGKGNRASLEATIDSCRAALKVVQGR